MTVEEALVIVDTVLKPRYLNHVQELVLRQSWEGRTYSEIAASHGYDSEYIKNVGFGLWQSLSEKLGEKVSKSNFRSMVRRRASQLVSHHSAASSLPLETWEEASPKPSDDLNFSDRSPILVGKELLEPASDSKQTELKLDRIDSNSSSAFLPLNQSEWQNFDSPETEEDRKEAAFPPIPPTPTVPSSPPSLPPNIRRLGGRDSSDRERESVNLGQNTPKWIKFPSSNDWRITGEKEWEKKRFSEREIEVQTTPTIQPESLLKYPTDLPLSITKYSKKAIINRRQDWEKAIDISIFYGRNTELSNLKQWLLEDRCRLVALFGMGGIGKTTLSLKVAKEIADDFEFLIWRSLLQAPQPIELVNSWLKFIDPQKATELPDELNLGISQLIEYLQKHRCLLVLDDVEMILRSGDRAGYYREGYEDYELLFKRLGVECHESSVLLTSREQPKELASLSGKKVRSLQLGGLTESAALEIIKEKGCLKGGEEEWKQVIRLYQGNPLALKIVSTTIQELFDNNVAEFLNQGTVVFGDIRDLLDRQFDRLSDLEKEIMYWLAVETQVISLTELRQNITSRVLASELLEALESLQRRSLIEKNSGSFSQKPVIKEYMNNRLIAQIYQKKSTQEALPYSGYALINRLLQNPNLVRYSLEKY